MSRCRTPTGDAATNGRPSPSSRPAGSSSSATANSAPATPAIVSQCREVAAELYREGEQRRVAMQTEHYIELGLTPEQAAQAAAER